LLNNDCYSKEYIKNKLNIVEIEFEIAYYTQSSKKTATLFFALNFCEY